LTKTEQHNSTSEKSFCSRHLLTLAGRGFQESTDSTKHRQWIKQSQSATITVKPLLIKRNTVGDNKLGGKILMCVVF
jgi:hypothetical protein